MISEHLLTKAVQTCTKFYLNLKPTSEVRVPAPAQGKKYMLYMHVPFCERLCPYCSFNRFPHSEDLSRPYFANMRKEMLMLAELGYDFDSVYIGGGTPTIMLDELCETIDLARDTFHIKEVSCETNPNHLIPTYIDKLKGRVQRLSVGVQSFDDGLLKQMDRFDKYGSGQEVFERIAQATPNFWSLNADMIFNFPAQTPDILIKDIERVVEAGVSQTTFYPLMASPSVQRQMARTVGKVDYNREYSYYKIICELLHETGAFEFGSAWTFNRVGAGLKAQVGEGGFAGVAAAADYQFGTTGEVGAVFGGHGSMIDEYVVNYEEYPAIGSGGITYLGDSLYVNTFSLKEYNRAIESGHMSISSKTHFSLHDRMRYRFMMQLFGLRLDKQQFKRDFGITVERGLPAEMKFMRAAGAFEIDDPFVLTLTPKGRYLVVVMMRQFFIGVNNLRDQARAALKGDERELLFGAGK